MIVVLADPISQLIQLLKSELDGDQIGGLWSVHRCCFELELIIQTPVPCTRTAMPPLRLSTVASSYDSPELLITTVCVLSVHQQRCHLSDANAIHEKHVATEFVFAKDS